MLVTLTFSISFAQEVVKREKESNTINSTQKTESTQTVEGDVIFSDGTNQFMRITDESTLVQLNFTMAFLQQQQINYIIMVELFI